MQRILQVNQFPQVVGLHVFGLSSADLNFSHRYQHLVANDFDFWSASFRRHALFQLKSYTYY